MSTRTQTWEVASRGQTIVHTGALSLAACETNWEGATGEILRCGNVFTILDFNFSF